MALVFDTVVGVAITVVANGALLYGGHLAARRLWPEARPSVRLVANGVIALALTLAVFYPLALAGLFTRWAVAACCLVIGAAAHVAWGRHRAVRTELAAAAAWARGIARSRGALLALGAAIVLSFAAFRAATRPPLSWDSLTYHDFLAGTWVQAGALVRPGLSPAVADYVYHPAHFEALVAWAMVPFGDDFVVNFVNFPILALLALVAYALGRELGLCPFNASLAAALTCGSPALLAYLCTQYNDILVPALLVAGCAFALRSIRHMAWRDAAVAFLACGLAVGTKYSALAPAALVCVSVVVGAAAVSQPGARLRRGAAALALGLLVVTAVGFPKYLANWAETRNPFYPVPLRLLGREVLPGSPYFVEQARRLGTGSWRDDLRQLRTSMTYAYGAEPTPLTWGPKLPLLLVLAVLGLVAARRTGRPCAVWILGLWWALPLLAFYLDQSPSTVGMRRFWQESSARFIAPSVALMSVGAMVGVSLLRSATVRPLAKAMLCGLFLYDLCVMTVVPDSPAVLAVLGLALAVVLGLAAWARLPRRVVFRRAAVAGACVAAVLGACGLRAFRDAKRWRFFATRLELHPFPRHYVEGWASCDAPGERRAIALTSYERRIGHHWFFYPLMGRRLQNRVLYVPIAGPDGKPHEETWLRRLREAGVGHVFVQLNPAVAPGAPGRAPIEAKWMAARPDRFAPVASGDHYKLYRLR